MLTEEQIKNRTSYLGGTEAAAVLGISRWKTPLQVWAEKVGHIQPEDISDQLHVKLGNRLEATVADLFAEETGKKVRRANETIFHPAYDFLGANVDRLVIGEDAGLEVKTVSAWKAKEWQDEDMPIEYIMQCLHYMGVTGRRKWYLAVLIGNHEFKWKEILYDEKVIRDLIRREVDFWTKYVVPIVMPAIVTKNDADTLYKIFPVAIENKAIELGDETNLIVEALQSYQQDLKNLEGHIDEKKNELKMLLKENEAGRTSKYVITWKNKETTRIDVERLKQESPAIYEEFAKTTSTRELRIKTPKEN